MTKLKYIDYLISKYEFSSVLNGILSRQYFSRKTKQCYSHLIFIVPCILFWVTEIYLNQYKQTKNHSNNNDDNSKNNKNDDGSKTTIIIILKVMIIYSLLQLGNFSVGSTNGLHIPLSVCQWVWGERSSERKE